MDVILWGVLPYVALAVMIGGTIWRYRYDKLGWTTRYSPRPTLRMIRSDKRSPTTSRERAIEQT